MSNRKTDKGQSARFAYEGLDRSLHEKARLGIMTSLLARPEGLLFTELKNLCALTDGNLSRHIAVLHEQGLVEIWKGYDQRRPQTLYRLTAPGRRRFLDYVAELEKVVKDASAAEKKSRAKGQEPLPELPLGWVPARS